MFNINDKNLINDITNEFSELIGKEEKDSGYCFEHPLDGKRKIIRRIVLP